MPVAAEALRTRGLRDARRGSAGWPGGCVRRSCCPSRGCSPHPRCLPSSPEYRLYVANESSDLVSRVVFIPGEGLAVEKEIPVGIMPADNDGAHGLSVSPDGKYWYVTIAHGTPRGLSVEVPRGPRHAGGPHAARALPGDHGDHPGRAVSPRGELQPARRHGAVGCLGGLHAGDDRGHPGTNLPDAARQPGGGRRSRSTTRRACTPNGWSRSTWRPSR